MIYVEILEVGWETITDDNSGKSDNEIKFIYIVLQLVFVLMTVLCLWDITLVKNLLLQEKSN